MNLTREYCVDKLKQYFKYVEHTKVVKRLELQIIPCIMHVEIYACLKILTIISQDDISNTQGYFLECMSGANSEY